MPGPVDRAVANWHLRRRDKQADRQQLPNASARAGTDCLPQIRHVVVLMMENHSFDNYFGTLGHGEGLTKEADGGWGPGNKDSNGNEIRPFHFDSPVQHSGVPTQTWHASHIQYDDGANDGFVRSVEQTLPGKDPRVPMGYWTEADLPFYAGLARTFALADRWHCSLLGPTFPNRRFLIAGTANGLIDDVFTGMIDYPHTGTIFDLLDRYGIPWVNYHHVSGWNVVGKRLFGNVGLRTTRGLRLGAGTLFPQLLHTGLGDLQFTADLYPLGLLRCLRHLRGMERFFHDAEQGTLPALSIVDPDFQSCSEENPRDIRLGEGFAAAVVDALMHGAGWPHTLLIWLYDEHGGYFDHVPPPIAVPPDDVRPRSLLNEGAPIRWLLQQFGMWNKLRNADSGAGNYDRYGFRVPAVVVSPYAKAGFVSHTTYDHTSVLKLLERKWNLPPLTARDGAAVDPLDMLDLDNPPFLQPPTLPKPAQAWQPG